MKEISVNKYGHMFRFVVRPSGKVECSIDDGKCFPVKEVKANKVFFSKKQEITLSGDLAKIDSLALEESDFSLLNEAILGSREKKKKSAGSDKQPKQKVKKAKISVTGVDEWKKKLSTFKDKNGKKVKCGVHVFRIGNNKYQFIERDVPGVGIIVNPDYKVSDSVPDIGGLPKKYGELMFWDYFFEGEGWKRVREFSNNELICLDIIQKHGFFSAQDGE